MKIPRDEFDSVRLSYGFKPKRKGVKYSNHLHVLDKMKPTARTPSGKTIGICSKCKGGFCIEEERRKETLIKKDNLDFDDAIHAARLEQRKKQFWRNKKRHNRPYPNSYYHND